MYSKLRPSPNEKCHFSCFKLLNNLLSFLAKENFNINFPLLIILLFKSNNILLVLRSAYRSFPISTHSMCLSLKVFVYHQFTISYKIIFIIIILKVFLYSKANADEDLSQQTRAIGGESLDISNFGLYIDENGSRFIEVPYEYMRQWLKDQKMWRTVRRKKLIYILYFIL